MILILTTLTHHTIPFQVVTRLDMNCEHLIRMTIISTCKKEWKQSEEVLLLIQVTCCALPQAITQIISSLTSNGFSGAL